MDDLPARRWMGGPGVGHLHSHCGCAVTYDDQLKQSGGVPISVYLERIIQKMKQEAYGKEISHSQSSGAGLRSTPAHGAALDEARSRRKISCR